jgi:hypothetical protein
MRDVDQRRAAIFAATSVTLRAGQNAMRMSRAQAKIGAPSRAEDQDSLSRSSPVFGFKGMAVGAINISTLTTRFSKQQAEKAPAPALPEGSSLLLVFSRCCPRLQIACRHRR